MECPRPESAGGCKRLLGIGGGIGGGGGAASGFATAACWGVTFTGFLFLAGDGGFAGPEGEGIFRKRSCDFASDNKDGFLLLPDGEPAPELEVIWEFQVSSKSMSDPGPCSDPGPGSDPDPGPIVCANNGSSSGGRKLDEEAGDPVPHRLPDSARARREAEPMLNSPSLPSEPVVSTEWLRRGGGGGTPGCCSPPDASKSLSVSAPEPSPRGRCLPDIARSRREDG